MQLFHCNNKIVVFVKLSEGNITMHQHSIIVILDGVNNNYKTMLNGATRFEFRLPHVFKVMLFKCLLSTSKLNIK